MRTVPATSARRGVSVQGDAPQVRVDSCPQRRGVRDWRTRRDPFGDVLDAEVVPLLKADDKRVLQATTLIELLQERHPGQFIDGQARTLQRRLRDWRAVAG